MWTWLMLNSESEYWHSSVILCPSSTGWVGPLMSKVAACGQRLQKPVIDRNMNRQRGALEWGPCWADLLWGECGCCSGQHFQNNLSLFLTFVSGSCWKTTNTLKVTMATWPQQQVLPLLLTLLTTLAVSISIITQVYTVSIISSQLRCEFYANRSQHTVCTCSYIKILHLFFSAVPW